MQHVFQTTLCPKQKQEKKIRYFARMVKTTHFYTYFYLLLLTTTAIFSVKGDVCYKVIPNVPCLDKDLGTKCLPACEKACGLSVLAICINPGPGLGYNCACSIVVPDCSKKRPC